MMNIKYLENENIKEFYKNSESIERLAAVTRDSWIKNKLVPPDYSLESTSNHLLTMENRFPHLVIFLLYEDNSIIGWIGISKSNKGQLEIDRWHPVIHPAVDEEKISHRLLKECLKYTIQHKYKEISVTFAISNDKDQSLFDTYYKRYKSINFKKSYEMIFMTLDLPKRNLSADFKQSTYQLLPLVDADEDQITECLYKSFKNSKDRYFNDFSEKEIKEEFKRRIDPISVVNESSIAMKDGNNIIGFGLVKNREFDIHLDLLCVHPAYRRKGFSKIIMTQIFYSLINQEISVLTLGVDPINSEALLLYKKLNFKERNSIVELSFIPIPKIE